MFINDINFIINLLEHQIKLIIKLLELFEKKINLLLNLTNIKEKTGLDSHNFVDYEKLKYTKDEVKNIDEIIFRLKHQEKKIGKIIEAQIKGLQ